VIKKIHLTLGLALAFVACVEVEESIGTLVHEDGPRGAWEGPLQQDTRAVALVGRDEAGAIAVVRVDDGEVVTRFASAELTGLTDVSAAFDADGALSHLALLSHDEEDQFGVLGFASASEGGFGPRIEGAEYQGQTRVLALPEGALVMQDDIGQRWSFARLGETTYASTTCPMPASIFGLRTDSGSLKVRAFAWDADEHPTLVEGSLLGGKWHCQLGTITTEGPLSRSARVALVKGIGPVVVDATKAHMRVATLSDVELGPFRASAFYGERIEHVEPWALEDSAGLVVLATNPTAVSVLSLREEADSRLTIVEQATVLLPAVTESTWFSRELVVTKDRVFVATSSGLIGFELGLSPTLGLHPLELPQSLRALRGPLVALPALPSHMAGSGPEND